MRTQVKKTQRGETPKEQIEAAVAEVIQGKSIRQAAKDYNMNYKTLGRYLKIKQQKGSIDHVGYVQNRFVLNDELQTLLESYIKRAAQIYHGLTPVNVRKLAYQLGLANNASMPKNWIRDEMAGQDWFNLFLKRHPTLAIRQPEATSIARAVNFNKYNVNTFYDNLENVYSRGNGLGPESIYNADETGVRTVQRPCKIVSEKGLKQVGSTVSQEKGEMITLCCAVNALGHAIPPFFVFPRVKIQRHWTLTAPPGSKAIGSSSGKNSGWMTAEGFLQFMEHFVFYAKPTKERPVLLILDNHFSHIDINILDFCKDNNITLLSFPPHCSHALQPLDRTVFGPMKKYLNQAMDSWMRNPENAAASMTIHILPSMVSYAFPKAMSQENIQSGFKCTGIYPFSRNEFSDADFAPASVHDRPLKQQGLSDPENVSLDDHLQSNCQDQGSQDFSENIVASSILISPEAINEAGPSATKVVTPQEIRPFARARPRDPSKPKRNSGRSAIYTDTPEKNAIALTVKRKINLQAKRKVKKEIQPRPIILTKQRKRNFFYDYSTSESSDNEYVELETESDISIDEDLVTRKNPNISDLEIDDHILVKFLGKSSVKYFVGRIQKILADTDEIETKFMRRLPSKNKRNFTFAFPKNNDICVHHINDVELRLPLPTPVGETARCRDQYKFICKELRDYTVQ